MTTHEVSQNSIRNPRIARVTSKELVTAPYLGMPSVLSLATRSARSDHLRLAVLNPVDIDGFTFDGGTIRGVCYERLFRSHTTFDCDFPLQFLAVVLATLNTDTQAPCDRDCVAKNELTLRCPSFTSRSRLCTVRIATHRTQSESHRSDSVMSNSVSHVSKPSATNRSRYWLSPSRARIGANADMEVAE